MDRVERERLKQDKDKKSRLALWYLMMTRRQTPPGPRVPRTATGVAKGPRRQQTRLRRQP